MKKNLPPHFNEFSGKMFMHWMAHPSQITEMISPKQHCFRDLTFFSSDSEDEKNVSDDQKNTADFLSS